MYILSALVGDKPTYPLVSYKRKKSNHITADVKTNSSNTTVTKNEKNENNTNEKNDNNKKNKNNENNNEKHSDKYWKCSSEEMYQLDTSSNHYKNEAANILHLKLEYALEDLGIFL